MARKPPGSAIFRTGASPGPSASPPAFGGGIPLAPADIDHPFFRQRELLSVPADVVQRVPQLARRLARWDRTRALSLLAGLQLEPRYHANHLRLTWATRLVLGLAQGDQRIGRSDLMRLVNADLGKTDLLDMEDPIEDFFLSPIATRHGEIPILNGVWAHPAFYADCFVEAFARVGGVEDSAPISAVDALLALSRAGAARAGLARRIAALLVSTLSRIASSRTACGSGRTVQSGEPVIACATMTRSATLGCAVSAARTTAWR